MMSLTKKNTIKPIRTFLILAFLMLTLESCRRNGVNHARIENAVEVFFICVTQIFNIIVFGTMALIFSIIGSTHAKQGMRVTGAVITGVFGLIVLVSFFSILDHNSSNPLVYMVFLIAFAILGIAIYFSTKKRVPKQKKSGQQINTAPTLDEIINDDDEIV